MGWIDKAVTDPRGEGKAMGYGYTVRQMFARGSLSLELRSLHVIFTFHP